MAIMSKGQPGTETLQAAIMKLGLEGAPIVWKVPEAGSQQEEGAPSPIVQEPAYFTGPACSARQVDCFFPDCCFLNLVSHKCPKNSPAAQNACNTIR